MASADLKKPVVLFVCTHNSSRSQMAEGLLRHLYGNAYEACSAGTTPTGVSPFAVAVMREIGIDISEHTSEHVDAYASLPPDYVVTVCDSAREACPYVPAQLKVIHRRFVDPRGVQGTDDEKRAVYRQVRNEIQTWLQNEFVPVT